MDEQTANRSIRYLHFLGIQVYFLERNSERYLESLPSLPVDASQDERYALIDPFIQETSRLRESIITTRRKLRRWGVQIPRKWCRIPYSLGVVLNPETGEFQINHNVVAKWRWVCDDIDITIEELEDSLPETTAAEASGKLTWQEVGDILERRRRQGEAYSSQSKLADQIGCSAFTVNKAIRNSELLQSWANITAIPKAQSIGSVVLNSTAQERELRPEDEAAISEYVQRDDIGPEERAFFHSLTPASQVEFLDGLDDPRRILGRKA